MNAQFKLKRLRARIRPLEELQKKEIKRALRVVDGNIPLAAKLLGVGKTSIYRKLSAYGLKKPARHVGRILSREQLKLARKRIKPWRRTEMAAITRAVTEAGDKTVAALLLGIGHTTVYRKLKQ